MATIQLQEPAVGRPSGGVFFAAGFRPFFLFAALQAAVFVPLWLAVQHGHFGLDLPYAPVVWHGHEMVFGFGGAAVGGFLLTAVPNWTGSRPVSGVPLMVLFALWLAGRAAMALGGVLPAAVVAAVDLAYLPVLAALMAAPLFKAGKPRNAAFVLLLALLWTANLAVHLDLAAGMGDALTGVRAGLFLLILMIAIVGGRIIPSFTQNWCAMQRIQAPQRPIAWVEKGGAQASVAASAVLFLAAPHAAVTGVVLLAASAIQLLRLSRWHGLKTVKEPILVILHVGYLWMAVGLALLGLSALVPAVSSTAAVHALAAGAVGTMVMAVMSRAALGHSGRPLKLSPVTVVAYGLVTLAAVMRVAGGFTDGAVSHGLTHGGGLAWAAAWLLFAIVYGPIVARRRADGRPG